MWQILEIFLVHRTKKEGYTYSFKRKKTLEVVIDKEQSLDL